MEGQEEGILWSGPFQGLIRPRLATILACAGPSVRFAKVSFTDWVRFSLARRASRSVNSFGLESCSSTQVFRGSLSPHCGQQHDRQPNLFSPGGAWRD